MSADENENKPTAEPSAKEAGTTEAPAKEAPAASEAVPAKEAAKEASAKEAPAKEAAAEEAPAKEAAKVAAKEAPAKEPAKDVPAKDATKPRKAKAKAAYDYRIPEDSRWAGLWKMWAGVGVVGLVVAAIGYFVDPNRFAFSYLFAFICALSLALGSLFFIIIERLTSAYWSVSVRRIAEFFASGFPVLVALFVPVLLCMGTLFPWLHEGASKPAHEATSSFELKNPLLGVALAQGQPPPGAVRPVPPHHGDVTPGAGAPHPAGRPAAPPVHGGHAEESHHEAGAALEAVEEETMAKKAGYLNEPFFLARIVLYFSAWLFLALKYFRLSTQQDASKDPALTLQAQSFAPVATILFGLSLTFAAFDWIMSLEPSWFSTIFGVTYFAGCVVTIFATIAVVAMALREDGLLKNAVTVEHFHDLGKLLFGFLVFWAYVSFSQFMLIWYAALPEETTFYHHRWDVGPWAYVTLLIVIAHFIVPFFILLSRNVKRRLPALRVGALWLLVMHVVEMYWLVMPNYNHGESSVSWIDLACLAGVVGVYLAVVFRNMTRYPLIPVGDPRLARSLAFENA